VGGLQDEQHRIARSPIVELRTQLQRCLDRFRAGALSEADFETALDLVDRRRKQSILYIQAPTTYPHDMVIGMSIYEKDKDFEDVDETGKFLYQTIDEALEDGWRIIKFPEVALVLDDQNTCGLGYEFVLERWT
jgi:hypothetical protein